MIMLDGNPSTPGQKLEGHSTLVISVAFSYDSVRFASASCDNTVKIWDVGRSEWVKTFHICEALSGILFVATGSYLHTKVGTIVIGAS